ncbi:hypothetical protein HYC85_000246 [Camellia sinensis]|uniref:Uncharacterized protein n=1 Tax=Camellia sinensis TaxID=4442 RepID=A0A7J7I328_CAMSI|nr:hypothetical protein HYC85_000246 [Camellia sinensis]
MEMEYVTEFHHTHTDRRPKKRPRLGWDVSHTPKVKSLHFSNYTNIHIHINIFCISLFGWKILSRKTKFS